MRKKERIRHAIQVLRERFQKAGMPIDDVTIDFAKDIAKDRRFLEIVKTKPKQLPALSTFAGIFIGLEEDSQLPQGEWDRKLEKLMQKLPHAVRSEFRPRMRAAFKDLPKRLSTGRPKVLSPSKQAQACDLVTKYFRKVDLREAYVKVANKMNCSPRTIQRVWRKKRSLPSAIRVGR